MAFKLSPQLCELHSSSSRERRLVVSEGPSFETSTLPEHEISLPNSIVSSAAALTQEGAGVDWGSATGYAAERNAVMAPQGSCLAQSAFSPAPVTAISYAVVSVSRVGGHFQQLRAILSE